MNKYNLFYLVTTYIIITIIGILIFPLPLYTIGASSIIHALYLAIGIDNPIIGYISLIYMLLIALYFIICCILSYKGRYIPAIIALIIDLFVSAIYIAYALFNNVGLTPHFYIDLIGFVIRSLFIVIILLYKPK